jgi:hypothetical protein
MRRFDLSNRAMLEVKLKRLVEGGKVGLFFGEVLVRTSGPYYLDKKII